MQKSTITIAIVSSLLLPLPIHAMASSVINRGASQKIERSVPATTLFFAAIASLPRPTTGTRQEAIALIDHAGKPVIGWDAGGGGTGLGYRYTTQRFSEAFAARLAAGDVPQAVQTECQNAAESTRLAGYVFSAMASTLQNQTFSSVKSAISTAQNAFLAIPLPDLQAMNEDAQKKANDGSGTVILGDLPTCQQNQTRFIGTDKGWLENRHGVQWFGNGVLQGRSISYQIEMSAGSSMSAVVR